MDWTAASAIAEVVGAIAVVASLIYIATQIRQNSDLLRQNTEIARSTIIHETSAMYVGMHAQIAQNEELADIYRRGMDNESLDETEQVRYIALGSVGAPAHAPESPGGSVPCCSLSGFPSCPCRPPGPTGCPEPDISKLEKPDIDLPALTGPGSELVYAASWVMGNSPPGTMISGAGG